MSKVAQNRAAKQELIYDAAATLFAQNGFANARMADIATEAGMSKPTLYHYFDSKEELLAALVGSRVGTALDRIRSIAESGGTATERLTMAVRSHLEVFQTHHEVYTIYDSERFTSISAELSEQVDTMGREYEEIWVGLIEEGVGSGEFYADLDTRVAMKAMVGACNSTLGWYRSSGRLGVEDLADEFSALFLRGIQAQP